MDKPITKDIADVAAGSAAIGAYFAWLPELAALLAAIWTGIRIYEWIRVRLFKQAPYAISPDIHPDRRLDKIEKQRNERQL